MRKLSILYATQTGNALDAAEHIAREADRRGCPAVLYSVNEYDAVSCGSTSLSAVFEGKGKGVYGCEFVLFSQSLLPHEDIAVFVVSTTGQGDPPDSMKVGSLGTCISAIHFLPMIADLFYFLDKVFWKFLLQRNLSPSWLEGLCYAVFGLGDSVYQKYNVRFIVPPPALLW